MPPKVEKKPTPKTTAPKKDAPKTETAPKKDAAPKKEAPKKTEAPKKEEAPKVEAKVETPKVVKPKVVKEKKVVENKHKFVPNLEKLEQIKKLSKEVRTGGKGTMRRTHKKESSGSGGDDAKLQNIMKKQNIKPIDVDNVTFVMEDDSVMHFGKPKLQANMQANTYVVSGKFEKKSLQDVLPSMFGMEGMNKLGTSGDDDIPELESFDTEAKN